MASISADALMDEEMVDARDLKRRSLTTLSELAEPAEKHAKFNPQSLMCEDTSRKAVGASSEELVPIEMPKEYKKTKLVDLVSGDVLLLNPPPCKKQYTFLDGNFLIVECELYGRQVLWDKVVSLLHNQPYEHSESEGKTVIDLIELNSLRSLPPPPSDEHLRKYLNRYMDGLIQLLKDSGAKEMPDREKVIDYLVTHRQDIDFFMGANALRYLLGSVVCAHYKNGRSEAPTIMYFNHGIKIEDY